LTTWWSGRVDSPDRGAGAGLGTADPAEVREWLRRFWHEVLGVELPPTANPVEAGASSISVVRMTALMRCAPLADIERLVTGHGERGQPDRPAG
jgi:hypothetical protein